VVGLPQRIEALHAEHAGAAVLQADRYRRAEPAARRREPRDRCHFCKGQIMALDPGPLARMQTMTVYRTVPGCTSVVHGVARDGDASAPGDGGPRARVAVSPTNPRVRAPPCRRPPSSRGLTTTCAARHARMPLRSA
jgi:hypothetical protein